MQQWNKHVEMVEYMESTCYDFSEYKNSSGDEIANVNFFTKISHTYGRLSTHADPTRVQRAVQIGKRTGHAYEQAPIRIIAHPYISHFGLQGEQNFPKREIICPGCR